MGVVKMRGGLGANGAQQFIKARMPKGATPTDMMKFARSMLYIRRQTVRLQAFFRGRLARSRMYEHELKTRAAYIQKYVRRENTNVCILTYLDWRPSSALMIFFRPFLLSTCS